MGVMQQPVEQGRGNHSVAEQLAPVAEVFVAGQDGIPSKLNSSIRCKACIFLNW